MESKDLLAQYSRQTDNEIWVQLKAKIVAELDKADHSTWNNIMMFYSSMLSRRKCCQLFGKAKAFLDECEHCNIIQIRVFQEHRHQLFQMSDISNLIFFVSFTSDEINSEFENVSNLFHLRNEKRKLIERLKYGNSEFGPLKNVSQFYRPSYECFQFIKSHQVCHSEAHFNPDSSQWEIGWGCKQYENGKLVREGDVMDNAKIDYYFQRDIEIIVVKINNYILPCKLQKNQFDALVSFAFNMDPNIFWRSNLFRKVKRSPNDRIVIRDAFMADVKEGDTKMFRRRSLELELYFK